MKIFFGIIVFGFIFQNCNYVTYNTHSKKRRMMERPSPLLFDRMVDFRIEYRFWPSSRIDFMSKGKKYYDLMENFHYATLKFDIKDSNNMTFYFNDHTKDLINSKETGKIDLNNYHGSTKFYKENDKFLWKLKMK